MLGFLIILAIFLYVNYWILRITKKKEYERKNKVKHEGLDLFLMFIPVIGTVILMFNMFEELEKDIGSSKKLNKLFGIGDDKNE